MASDTRIRKVADALRRVLAQALVRDIADPRLKLATISAVEVTRDLAHAKVYVSTLGDNSDIPEVLKGLERAKGFLKSILAKECQLRIVPNLHFFHDISALNSQHISQAIEKALAKDNALKPAASDAEND